MFIHLFILKLKEHKFDLVDEAYLNALFGINKTLSFENSNKTIFEGKMIGVSNDGKLRVELPTFEIREFEIKEIKFLG